MTKEEFKKLKPEYKDIEGDELWDAMTAYKLRLQEGEKILNTIKPFWKRYRLRWLFYGKLDNFVLGKSRWASDRCKNCKKGVNSKIAIIDFETNTTKSFCIHCSKEYIAEPNTNLDYRIYKIFKSIAKLFWNLLDFLHLVRSSHFGRYNMFGDESNYVSGWSFNYDNYTGMHPLMKKRKWWEYIIIEK